MFKKIKSLETENNFLKELIKTHYQPEIERLSKIINIKYEMMIDKAIQYIVTNKIYDEEKFKSELLKIIIGDE